MWRARAPDPAQVKALREIRRRHDIHPLVIHANYLVNLASPDPVIRGKSIAAFRGELERAALLGAEFLVVHPGSYRGRTLEEGIAACAEGLREAAAGFHSSGVTVLLENTAGSGFAVGSRFEELRAIRDRAGGRRHPPIGYCLDTCHLLAAGFDITTVAGLRATLHQAERVLDLTHVHVFHANDSKAPLGSRVDRHAKIGHGHIGAAPFHRLLANRKLRSKVFISETPVEIEGDDRRNFETLKSLAPRAVLAEAAGEFLKP
jgi:deoxyribonuclease-4